MSNRNIVRGPSTGGLPNANYVNRSTNNIIYQDGSTDRLVHGTGTSGTTTAVILDDQGSVGASARLPVFNTTDKAMGNAAAAISLFTVTVASLAGAGGTIVYNYASTDGTDASALSGLVEYAIVNKAGTLTTQITEATANQAKAISKGAGTLTIAWTIVDGGSGLATIKAATTDSLTTTTAVLSYTVIPVRGTVVLV